MEMRSLLLLFCASLGFAQVLTYPRVSQLNNRYHGRPYGRVRTQLPVTSNLFMWLKPESLPATAGTSITSWADSSGQGHGMSCSSDCPTTHYAYAGYPSALFTALTYAGGNPMTASGASGASTSAYSVFVVFRRQGFALSESDSYVSSANLFDAPASSSGDFGIQLTNDDNQFYTQAQCSHTWFVARGLTSFPTQCPSAGVYTWDGPTVLGIVATSGNVTTYSDDGRAYNYGAATSVSGTTTSATLGCYYGGGFCFSGDIYELLWYNATLSSTQISQVLGYLQDRYSLHRPRNAQVISASQSTTGGYDGQPSNIMTLINDTLLDRYNFRNESAWGWTSGQINTNWTKVIGQYYDPSQTNVVQFQDVTNCLGSGETTTQCYDDYVTFYNTAHAAGWKVIACTALVNNVSNGNYSDANRQAVNASIRANWSAVSDTSACDIGNDSVLGNTSSLTDTNIFQADEKHLAPGGQAIYAGYVVAALHSLGIN
jgi:hypothetical protein